MKKVMSLVVVTMGLLSFTQCSKKGCTEKITENCLCTLEYNPVCGCNGKTYGNSCDAECHGITTYSKGECK